MRYLTLDVETSIFQKGNPYSERNKLCYIGCLDDKGDYYDFPIEYNDEPYGESLKHLQELIDAHDVLIGFNIKFDLHWLNRYGIKFNHKKIFDCQVAQFILSHQSMSYPSLNDCLALYGLEGKLDEVAEMWKKGIDTPDIPETLLKEYLLQDVVQTKELFFCQLEFITPKNKTLISLANQDLLTLLEIEKNGMLYAVKESVSAGDALQEKLDAIDASLVAITGCPDFKPSSGDHISAALYGGSVFIPYRESFIFTYKDGRTKEKERWSEREIVFPRLIDPPKGSELKKEGFYATNADTLNKLKGKHQIVSLLLSRSSLEKLRGTYLHGIPKLIEEMDWEGNVVHGTLNQCVAITGRLSSTKPNLQNFDKDIGNLFITRY